MSNVAIIGVGVMGSVAAEKIIKAGHSLHLFDVSKKAMAGIAHLGAQESASPREAAEKAEIILMFLPGPAQVRECVAGPAGLLEGAGPDTVIVDLSTVDPGVSQSMAKAAGAKGASYLDAPVLGRPAVVGKWALPVGGETNALERCRPVLEVLAVKIFHAGPSGMGNRIKLLNQMMFGAINAMTAEMMAVADKMGIAPKLLYETITASQAGTVSNLFKELGARIAEDDYSNPTFSVNLLIKDVSLAVEMARQSGALPVLGQTVEFINGLARAQGQGELDTAAMWKSMRGLFA
ncbi:MAG: NAD(P)-dependent oxidoreductase [Desulfarculaceae bacterium]